MEIRRKFLSLEKAILVPLAVWAAISVLRTFQNMAAPLGGNDLYTYWYAGLFIRQSVDPYQAFIQAEQPELPIRFLDGEAVNLAQITLPGLVPAPGYTYPFLLFFTLFAFLSWQRAKWLWLMVNLAIAIAVIPLASKTVPDSMRLSSLQRMALILLLLGASASRYALSSGQVTFLVLCLMLIAIRFAKVHPWAAGIALGLALSKYSLAAGLFLYYLLLEPNFRLVLSALLVQIAGIAALMISSGSTFFQVIQGYTLMFEHHVPMEGIHLASLFPLETSWLDLYFAIGFSILVLALLGWRRRLVHIAELRPIMIGTLFVWSLLVAYHHAYDAAVFVYILFVLMSFFAERRILSERFWLFGRIFIAASAILMVLPAGDLARQWLPLAKSLDWTFWYGRLTTLTLLLSLAVSILILFSPFSDKNQEFSYE